jgi:hypothetical protein
MSRHNCNEEVPPFDLNGLLPIPEGFEEVLLGSKMICTVLGAILTSPPAEGAALIHP